MSWFARVYPNGEFGLGFSKREEYSSILDSSNVSKSHSEIENRAERGSNGISAYGRKMVRNGAYLLEGRYGKERLGFLTLTLPPMSIEENNHVCEEWSEIVRQAMQSLRRKLRSVGLPGEIVGVVEIQPRRQERDGGMPLHLHLVFQAKKNRWEKGYPIETNEYREIWKNAVVARCPEFRFKMWNAAENVKCVRKSAEAYLGKYLSKGVGDLKDFKDSMSQKKLPSAWWVCSQSLKDAIKKNTRYGREEAELILSWMKPQHKGWLLEYFAPVELESEGVKTIIAWYGKVKNAHYPRLALGLSPWGSYEWDCEIENVG